MSGAKICGDCGYQAKGKTVSAGSILLEIALWLCFIVPGVLYSLWRSCQAVQSVCKKCGSQNLFLVNSTRGEKLMERFSDRENSGRKG